MGAFVVTSLVAGILAAGLAVPAIGASGMATTGAIKSFQELPSDLQETPMAANTTVLAADGSVLATFFDQNRELVKLDDISPFMQNAIVAIEDERFYEHGGVDPQGLIRALLVNEINGGVAQGASTLTQQLVKNMLQQQAYLAGNAEGVDAAAVQTNARKLKEIRLASALEQRKDKKEILQDYLNIAWFGSGQVYGIEAASHYYFNTSAKKLTLPQAAMLAGMIQSPTQFDISDKSKLKAAETRRNTVLNKMFAQKMIDEETRDKAIETKLRPKITPIYQGCANAGLRAYFCDYVYNIITKSNDFKSLGKTVEDRQKALKWGGYTIQTTLSPKLLKTSWNAAKNAIPPSDPSNVATAAVTVEPGTGNILSMTQNKYYNVNEGRKNTTVNYSTDYQYGGSSGFLTGSTFKPVVLATWLKSGRKLNSVIDGSPGSIAQSSFKSCGSNLRSTNIWNFVNSGDGGAKGSLTVWNATAKSINGAYIRMEQQLDLCDVSDMAAALGMHLAAPQDDGCDGSEKKHLTTKIPYCIPSVVLGVANQSPLTMANAYATFAASGKYCKPRAVTSIKDRNGKALKIPKKDCKQTIPANIANTVTLGLSRAFTTGTASHLGGLPNGQPASAKTGTTNNSQDTWFAGYTPQLATAVWVGPQTVNGQRKPMLGVTVNGHYWANVYGGSIGGPIWKSIMTTALQGKKVERFPSADSSLVGAEPQIQKPKTDKGGTTGGGRGNAGGGTGTGGNTGGNGGGNAGGGGNGR
ncbi:carboxypeptidase [Kineosporia sp. NBRC 101731]|nr:carboxypeptidase [Kineosporia sp. NBRC 101731]